MSQNRTPTDRRLTDMSADVAEELRTWTPDLPKVDTWEQTFPISDSVAYIQRLDTDERLRLVEWAVIQVRTVGRRPERVAVYDTCHPNDKGVHVHFYNRQGDEFAQETLLEVNGHLDLEEGLDLALQRVSESWEENERRSNRGY